MNSSGHLTSPGCGDSRDRNIALLLAVVSALFLFVFRSLYQTPDSLEYANSVRLGTDLFHPHHIIFSSVVRLIYFVAGALSGHYDAILAGQIHNIIWTALSIAFLFLIFRMLEIPRVASLLFAALLLVTSSFWNYATLVEVYMGAVGCLTLLIYFTLRWNGAESSHWRLPVLAILLAFSIMYHQTDVLFCIPFAYLFLHTSQKRRLRSLSFIILIAGALVLTVYIFAFLSINGEQTPAAFVRFWFSYASSDSPNWGTFRHFTPLGIGQLLKNQLRDFIPVSGGTAATVVIEVFLFALVLAAVIGHNLRIAIQRGQNTHLRIFLLLWLAVNYLFFLWWLPYDKEFYITTTIPIALLSALWYRDSIVRSGKSRRFSYVMLFTAAAILVGMFTLNLTSTVLPRHRSRGVDYLKAERMAAISSPDCKTFCDLGERNNLLYYFGRRNVDLAFVYLSYFYRNLPLPDRFNIASDECVFIPLKWVDPDLKLSERTGFNAPESWFNSVKWLFGIRQSDAGSAILHRDFRVVIDSSGLVYLTVGPGFSASDSLQRFFERLDLSIEDATGARYSYFAKWFRENRGKISLH